MNKAAFIDRDGTLIEEVNFLSRVEDLKIFDYTLEALDLLKANGFHIFVVTNQSGIGRNLYDEAAMHSIHKAMSESLGDRIDAYYFCPHLPDAGCSCRKPNLGMIEAAQRDFEFELEGSWIIGDKGLDIKTGMNAGIATAMVLTGYGTKHLSELGVQPDIVADNLLEAVRRIV